MANWLNSDFSRRAVGRLVFAGVLTMAAGITAASAEEKVLTVSNPFAPISLDPARSGYGRGGTALLPAYEPLVRTSADGTLQPALAMAWEVSPDNKSVTFTLRQDAKFSDGEPVTAEAAKRSIEYWSKAKGPLSSNLSKLTSIDVLDPYKFRVNVSVGNPNLASLFDAYWLAGNLISPKALDNPDGLLTQTSGAGPYMLDVSSTVSGKTYTYIPNPYYYDKSRVHWDKVVISIFEDATSAIQALQTGQLKLMVSDAATANSNKGNLPSTIRFVSSPLQVATLYLLDRNGERGAALKDIRVRQAINYALDRSVISQALFGDLGSPTAQLQARGFMGHDPEIENLYTYDVEKAKLLLKEAGFEKGFELKTGYINNTQSNLIFNAYAGQLSEVGITLTAVPYLNVGANLDSFRKKEVDAFINMNTGGPPNLTTPLLFDNGAIYNPYNVQDEKLDELFTKARSTPIANAADAWKAVFARAAELAWFAPVSDTHQTYIASDAVELPIPGATAIVDLTEVKPAK